LPHTLRPDPILRLRISKIEKVFTQFAMDWKEILVLDGIDKLEDPIGFRIRSHDLYGPLPDISPGLSEVSSLPSETKVRILGGVAASEAREANGEGSPVSWCEDFPSPIPFIRI
jgi:hypothetical protein